MLCAGSMLLLVQSKALDEAPYKLSGAVAKLAGITFWSLAFSYWFDKPRFLTKGRLATVLIILSSWSSQLGGYLPHQQPSSYCYVPIVQGRLLTHHSEGRHGDEEGLRWWFPSPAGCREELLDPTDLASMTAAACSMFFGKLIGSLGFSRRREYIGRRAALGGGPGGHTTWWRGLGVGRGTLWCACLLAPSISALDSVSYRKKIRTLAFTSSNSENTSCVDFLKHKNSRKQGTDTVASR
jgi:hypothetical protein